ncbi:MAG: hypothetical protein IJI61_03595 [Oscillospiraceae bacterium]|nr:hypothetical protein [Oscillospiraceae bacterium]
MFGTLIASASSLSEEELKRYKATYCGLCRSLKARHGQFSRLTLNYDMTFLILLLQSLYEAEETAGEETCIAHPREKRPWWRSEISDYAADMNVALSYLNRLDDWKDEGSVLALSEAGILKKAYNEIRERYPRQCAAMEQSVLELSYLEKNKLEDADAASATFGHLLGTVFVYREDRWKDTLYALGNSLGRFLYLMDATLDLEKDTYRNTYNPFRRYYGQDNESLFRNILKMFLADAVVQFDVLPLVQDVGLMKNILCVGLWSAFDEKFSRLRGKNNGTGSL